MRAFAPVRTMLCSGSSFGGTATTDPSGLSCDVFQCNSNNATKVNLVALVDSCSLNSE